jgi:hypothetical protein
MKLPRRPIASAHKTVRRPAETNQRKKLAAKKGVKEALMSKKWKCSKDWANIQILLTCKKKTVSQTTFTRRKYQDKHPTRPTTNINCSLS